MKAKRLITALAAISAFGFASAALAEFTAYDAIPSPQPGNVLSLGNEAYAQDELGDHVRFTGPYRVLSSVDVLMSSWACESGTWYGGTCSTTPGAKFSHPITLNIYAVDNSGPAPAVGALIASMTQTFDIPYRPSADPSCGTRWKDTDGSCFNGLATQITFDFIGDELALPDEVIYGVTYNTNTSGPSPLGVGGPYDSLNIGLAETAPNVGVDVEPDALFWDTAVCGWYTDGGAGGCDVFRRDTGWTPYTPTARFKMLAVPAIAGDCKKNGWMGLTRADGTPFKNQGDCVSYVMNGK
jgi:hypothetical protein